MNTISVPLAAAALVALTASAHAQDQDAMAKQGAPAYRLCAACHSLQPGINLSGPSLAGLWGRKAGTLESYGRYSKALKGLDAVWDEDTLNAWLADPQAMAPGTSMAFRGVENDDTRTGLIAFLRLAMAQGGADDVVKKGLIPQDMAEGQIPPDLSAAGDDQRITDISHCRDAYYVTTADGKSLPFWETNVRIKVDTSERGPKGSAPILQRSGMVGDRVSVVFSDVGQLRAQLKEECR